LLPRDGRVMSERSLSSESKRLGLRGWLSRAESRARELLRRSAGPWRRAGFFKNGLNGHWLFQPRGERAEKGGGAEWHLVKGVIGRYYSVAPSVLIIVIP